MRRLTVTLANGKKEDVEVPTTFYDCPTWLFEKIYDQWDFSTTPESFVRLFSIVTGGNYTDYINSTDAKIEKAILTGTNFFLNNVIELHKLPLPKTFKIEDKEVPIPTELKALTLGQNLYIRRLISNKDIRSGISLACAVYLQPLLDKGKFDDKRVEYYANEIKKMPITSTYAVGFFFLKPLNNYGNGQTILQLLILKITRSFMNVKLLLQKLLNQIYWNPFSKLA